MSFGPYSKFIVAIIGAVATWATVVLADGVVTQVEWISLIVPILTAAGVYQVSNSGNA